VEEGKPSTKKYENGQLKSDHGFLNKSTVLAEISGDSAILGKQCHWGLYFTDSSKLQPNIDNGRRVADCAKS